MIHPSYPTSFISYGSSSDEECFFPHCLRSIKAVEYVGEGDKHALIFVEKCKVVINSYKMLDQRKIQFPQELLSCIDPQLLPSFDFEGTWERSVGSIYIVTNHPDELADLSLTKI